MLKPIGSSFGAVLAKANHERQLTELTWEFQAWCQSNKMPEEGDALDLLHGAKLNQTQREYLLLFVDRWESAMKANEERAQ